MRRYDRGSEGAANHGHMYVRRDAACALRRDLGVREVRPALEHVADPVRRLLGDHARDAELPARRDRHRTWVRARLRTARVPRRREPHPPSPCRLGLLVYLVHALVAAENAETRPQPPLLEADAGVD